MKLNNEEIIAKLLGIRCQVTCGCGNHLVPYVGSSNQDDIYLGCKPYSEKYEHPQKIAISKDAPLIKVYSKLVEFLKKENYSVLEVAALFVYIKKELTIS